VAHFDVKYVVSYRRFHQGLTSYDKDFPILYYSPTDVLVFYSFFLSSLLTWSNRLVLVLSNVLLLDIFILEALNEILLSSDMTTRFFWQCFYYHMFLNTPSFRSYPFRSQYSVQTSLQLVNCLHLS